MLLIHRTAGRRDLEVALTAFEPDIAGVTSEIVRHPTALDALRRVRSRHPRCLTLAGGHHATMAPEEYVDPAIDLIVLGEAVQTIREICAERARGRAADYKSIAGLAIPQPDGSLRRTAARRLPTDLDDYPPPDRSSI
jgi:radical SAM superfamily enzyme YgiQ (UPF0313 family)